MSETAPKLIHVVRLDSYPAFRATFTEEGYLKDKPILTSTGIFEYKNPDGSIRRELRLPEDVFDPESLASYKGKPVVITHDAGLITSDNVAENQIGTILTDGERDGNDVRAEIVIHDTDALKECRFKELSLGYNLDLEEEPGIWNGQKYDAIQRNIRVNHLAVVREARAGDQARLNIDSRADKTILIGGRKTMAKKKAVRPSVHADGILSPEELQKAIAEYKARRAKANEDEEAKVEKLAEQEVVEPAEPQKPVEVKAEETEEKKIEEPVKKDEETQPEPEKETPELPAKDMTVEDKIEAIKARRDLRDEKGDPADMDGAMEQIAEQDEDIDQLHDIIDTLLAERDFGKHGDEGNETIPAIDPDNELHKENDEEAKAKTEDLEKEDACGEEKKEDSADEDIPDTTKEEVEADVDEAKLAKETEFGFDSDDDFDFEEEEEFEEDEDKEEDEDVAQFPDRDIPEAEAEDEDDFEEEEEEEEFAEDCGDTPLNYDSIDAIVQRQLRERLKIAKIGKMVNMDGLEYQSIKAAKRKIIRAVRPGVRLDGKSDTYINAMYDLAVDDIKRRNTKDTAYQKKQMFNKKFNSDSAAFVADEDSAEARRQKMIDRQENRNQK